MSLAISEEIVTEVLLADGWHRVEPGTFGLDAYEIHAGAPDDDDPYYTLRGGVVDGVPSTGFAALELNEHGGSFAMLYGPLTAILGLRSVAVDL